MVLCSNGNWLDGYRQRPLGNDQMYLESVPKHLIEPDCDIKPSGKHRIPLATTENHPTDTLNVFYDFFEQGGALNVIPAVLQMKSGVSDDVAKQNQPKVTVLLGRFCHCGRESTCR